MPQRERTACATCGAAGLGRRRWVHFLGWVDTNQAGYPQPLILSLLTFRLIGLSCRDGKRREQTARLSGGDASQSDRHRSASEACCASGNRRGGRRASAQRQRIAGGLGVPGCALLSDDRGPARPLPPPSRAWAAAAAAAAMELVPSPLPLLVRIGGRLFEPEPAEPEEAAPGAGGGQCDCKSRRAGLPATRRMWCGVRRPPTRQSQLAKKTKNRVERGGPRRARAPTRPPSAGAPAGPPP